MNSQHLALALAVAAALSGTLAAGAAHAGGRPNVQWSVTIGSPRVGVVVGAPIYVPPVYVPRFYSPRPYSPFYAQPVVVVPQRGVYRAGWRDADFDGIPNRYDHRYNPRGDRDGDGVSNRRDRNDRNPYRR